MMRIFRFFPVVVILLFLGLTLPQQVQAADSPLPPLKTSLLVTWEKNLRTNDTTVTLTKSPEKDVYQFETTLFPYKGRVKVWNVLVTKIDGRYDSDLNLDYDVVLPDGVYKGVVETDLLDTDTGHSSTSSRSDFFRTYYSEHEWNRLNVFTFDPVSKTWMTPSAFMETLQHKESGKTCAGSGNKKDASLWGTLSAIVTEAAAPIGYFLFLFAFIVLITRRTLKRQRKAFETSLENQRKSMERQERSIVLLQEILAELKRQP